MKLIDQYQSNLIISYRNGKFYIDKDIEGPMGESDLIGVMKALLPYADKFHLILEKCLSRLELYYPFE